MPTLRPTHWLILAGLMAFLVGCNCNPKTYNVQVTLADSLRDRTTYVDLVALNDSNSALVSNASMTAYWRTGDTFADSIDENFGTHRITFLKEGPHVHTLSRTDPIWDRWDDETTLFILASLSGSSDQPGELDARRLILPLGHCRWKGNTIEVLVSKDFITLTSELLDDPDD